MERRAFVRGLLAAAAGGEALITLATPADVAALTVGRDALIAQPAPPPPGALPWPGDVNGPTQVFLRREGGYVAVGWLTEVTTRCDVIDAGDDGHGWQRTRPGRVHVEGRFVGPIR